MFLFSYFSRNSFSFCIQKYQGEKVLVRDGFEIKKEKTLILHHR